MKTLRLLSIFLFLLSLTCLSSCDFKGNNKQSYKVALRLVPKNINPWNNQVNTNQLIMLQLYIPMFEIFERDDLKSRILDEAKTKALNSDFTQYQICPKDRLQFFDGTPVTLVDIEKSLRQSHNNLLPLQKIKTLRKDPTLNCVIVEFEEADPDYFRKLTSVSTSIFKASTLESEIPTGVGPYSIRFSTQDSLILDANKIFPSSIGRLEFLKFEDSWDEDQLAKVHDLNHVYQLPLPPDRKLSYKRVQRPSLKSYILFFGNYRAKTRRFLGDCLKNLPIGRVYGLNLQTVPGFLPRELLGYNSKFKAGKCKSASTYGFIGKPKFKLIHFNEKKVKELAFFFNTQSKTLPMDIEVEYVPFEKIPNKVLSHEPVITLIGIDSTGSFSPLLDGPSSFFRSFFGEKRLTKNKNNDIKELIDGAIDEKRIDLKAKLYRQAHSALLEKNYFLPLGQDILTQYYPPRIKEITWANPFSPFPLFSDSVIE